MKTTLADIIGTCERAAFRMGLEACDPPSEATATSQHGGRSDRAPLSAEPGGVRESAAPTWTDQQDAALLAMHSGGMSPADIAEHIDVSQEAIQERLLWLTLPRAHAQSA